MAGFVRVSGYSKADLDEAYEEGKADGTAFFAALSASEGSSSSTVTSTKAGVPYVKIFTKLSGSDASASVYINGQKYYSFSGSHDWREEILQTRPTLAVGDTIRATCNDVSGDQQIRAIFYLA